MYLKSKILFQGVQDKASNIYLITGACAWFQKNVNVKS